MVVVFIMVSARDIFNKMKVSELNNIIKIFELKVTCRKKENIIDIIYEYMKKNMIYIFQKHIISDELDLLRKVCDNNFKISYEEAELDLDHIQSLHYIGLIYINKEKTVIVIPQEFQELIKLCLDDKYVTEFSRKKADIVSMVQNLLELYGIFHLELLEDYIINKIGEGYRIHGAIEFIRNYNMRNVFYYEDDEHFYYNLKIINKDSMKDRILKIHIGYKYYNECDMKDIINRKSPYEKNVKMILNRVYKSLKKSEEIMSYLRLMIMQGMTSEEIVCNLKETVKRLSDYGLRSIVKYVDSIRSSYIIWGMKGYYLDEIDREIMA